ncbi:MAG: type II secretion system protein [Acholeplasmataceae bacterium]|jgi:type II secretory pathway pseudopilin PulG|nr:type II secretion system protein [Acholeplasmataceae bacterium]
MRLLKNKRGFTVLEAVASMVIITLVFTTAIATITAMRNQAIATENKRVAVDMASSIKDDLIQSSNYILVAAWLGSTEKVVDSEICALVSSVVSCDLFTLNANEIIPSDQILITFYAPTPETIQYEIIRFSVTVTYYKTRTITIEGVIYA